MLLVETPPNAWFVVAGAPPNKGLTAFAELPAGLPNRDGAVEAPPNRGLLAVVVAPKPVAEDQHSEQSF